MTVLVSDSFNRADNTTTLGTTDSYNGGTTYTWGIYNGGVWGVKTNQAYTSTAHADNTAYVDVGQSDNLTINLTIGNANVYTYGIAFRIQDANNFFRAYATGGVLKIDRKTAGTWTNIGSFSGSFTFPMSASITLSGSSITFNVGGIAKFSVTDTNFQTATQHGMYINNSTGVYLDSFEIDSTATGTVYSADGTASGIASATGSTIESLAGSGSVIGVSSATGSILFILGANGNTLGIASLTSNETMNIPSIFNASGTSSGLTNATGQVIIIMLATGTASGIADAEFFRFVFSPPPECMITSQILNYNQSFPVLIQDAVGATATSINVTPDANGYFQIKLPMEEVRVMVLINGKLYLDRYIWALDGESRLPIINYR